jgi:hypothetical protein
LTNKKKQKLQEELTGQQQKQHQLPLPPEQLQEELTRQQQQQKQHQLSLEQL